MQVTVGTGAGTARFATTARNSLWNAIRVGSSSITIVFVPVFLSSRLPTAEFTAWSAVFGLASIFLIFDFGLPTAIQFASSRSERESDSDPDAIGALAITLAGTLAIAILATATGVAQMVPGIFPDVPPRLENQVHAATLILIVSMAVTTSTNVIAAYYVGQHQSHIPALCVAPARVTSLAAVVCTSFATDSIVASAIAFGTPLLVSLVCLMAWCGTRTINFQVPSARSLATISREAMPLAVWSAATVTVTSSGALAVGHWDYNGLPALSVASAMGAAQAGLQTAIMASFGTEYGRQFRYHGEAVDSRVMHIFQRANFLILGIGFAGALFCVVAAGSFGLNSPYGDSRTSLVVGLVLGGTTLRLLSYPLSVAVIVRRRQGSLLVVVLIDAVVTASLVTIATRTWGVVGCAVATAVTGAISMLLAVILIARIARIPTLRFGNPLRTAAKCAALVSVVLASLLVPKREWQVLISLAVIEGTLAISLVKLYSSSIKGGDRS